MIRSLLQRVHVHSYCNREHKREPNVSVHHCRASLGLAGCKADFINPAVLLVAQVSFLVLEKRSILSSARTAKTQGELIYACESVGSPCSYMGVTSLAPLRISVDILRSGLSDRIAVYKAT